MNKAKKYAVIGFLVLALGHKVMAANEFTDSRCRIYLNISTNTLPIEALQQSTGARKVYEELRQKPDDVQTKIICLTTEAALYEYQAYAILERSDCGFTAKVCRTQVLLSNDGTKTLEDLGNYSCEKGTRYFPCD
jgi:hypothetical protein